jgi:hypothetical protein
MALLTGSSFLAVGLMHKIGERAFYDVSAVYVYGSFALGLISLIWNSVKAPTLNDRRKTQVMLWGTAAGMGPVILVSLAATLQHRVYYSYPFWIVVGPSVALAVLPVSFAYAVVKYRAFFRSAYDTRQIMIDLAAKTRNASNREQLAELLRHEIDEALHPATLARPMCRKPSGGSPATCPC